MFQFMRACMLFIGMCVLGITAANAQSAEVVRHTVKNGEFLVRIAQEYPGVNWRAIAKANKLQSPYVIYPEQVLVIPSAGRTRTTSSPIVTATQQTTASTAHTVRAELPVASEVVLTTDGPAHVFVGKVRNRITAETAIERLFDDVDTPTRERMRAHVTSGDYTPILLPVGYRINMMLTADGTVHENVLIAPMTDVPLLGMCYALPASDSSALMLIHEVHSWNWYREIIPIGQVANCIRIRTGLHESDIAPPSSIRRDEALMPYVAIPRSQAR